MANHTHRELFSSIQILAAVRTLAVIRAFEAFLSNKQTEFANRIERMWDYILGAQLIADSLGLSLSPEDVTPKEPDPDQLVLTLGENCVVHDRIASRLEAAYGNHAALNFKITQYLFMVLIFSDLHRQVRLRNYAKEKHFEIREDRVTAHALLTEIGQVISTNRKNLPAVFDQEMCKQLLDFAGFLISSKSSIQRFERTYQLSDQLTGILVPQLPIIEERRDRAQELFAALKKCPIGSKGWRTYENICIDVLRFLFVPPFRDVRAQPRTSDGLERRDAIILNDQESGFWGLIRKEFESRQIVCEFKNTSRPVAKDSLNQLRIYLSKPTIGRFGLLFHRKSAKSNLSGVQRQAYEQSRIMILMIDDDMIRKLLFARAFIGSSDSVLEKQKMEFEIAY